MSVAENIARIREGIGDRPVQLVAVSKYAQLPQIQAAYAEGVTEFGENRVPDALEKMDALQFDMPLAHWHLIGHLQTNKVKQSVGRFALIHSVDSLRVAQEIDKHARHKEIVQPILLQVKILPDQDKFGFSVGELLLQFPDLLKLLAVEVRGLMTITPLNASIEERQSCFEGLRHWRDELSQTYGLPLQELSMGMSDDWQEALRCGTTMVRIGSAIFKQ